MKHIVRKAYMDFEKEEKFLNNMSARGLALAHYSWCKYVFEETPKGKYIYRIELLEHPVDHPDSQEYIRFMEEAGAELVTSYNRWVYFRKDAADGEFVIFSDNESKIKHYSRILNFFLIILGLNLLAGFYNYYLGNVESTMDVVTINTYFAIISFVISALIIIFVVAPLVSKVNALKKETLIRE